MAAIASVAGLASPRALHAMQDVTPDTALRPSARTAVTLAARCAPPGRMSGDPFAAAVAEAMVEGPERLVAVVDSLEGELGPEKAHGSSDPSVRYHRAVVTAGRVETLEGGERVEAAETLYEQARRVFEVDPGHAGAHHLMGRLMAGVLRLGGFTRTMARVLVGGDLLSDANWPAARGHLERAEQDAPCIPEHHLELAKLLDERGDGEAARKELRHVLELVSEGHGTRSAEIRERALVMLGTPSR